MYREFFNLKVKPFELVPNPAFLYQSPSHKKALNYLNYGLLERVGFILLTGEVGSGKTTIIKDIINNLDDDIAMSIVFNTRVSSKQLLAMINEDFGLKINHKDKVSLLHDLNDHLLELYSQKKRPVVIIDEAQNLNGAALEEIRLLSNMEAANTKLIQIILVGQPELEEIIAKDELRQLRQRISVHCHLLPLTREEVEDYVFHRLEAAGNRNALIWNESTFDSLYKHSHGVPRLINIFCDFILLSAFAEETRELTLELVEEVINDVSWDTPFPNPVRQVSSKAKASSQVRTNVSNEKHNAMLGDVVEIKREIVEELLLTLIRSQKISVRQKRNRSYRYRARRRFNRN